MRNSKNKERCTKVTFSKHPGVCRTYGALHLAYAQQLEADENVAEFRCNIPLTDIDLEEGSFTTDFLCTKTDGDLMVRECVYRKKLSLPRTGLHLDASRNYWLRRGVNDWALVIEMEGSSDAEE